MKKEDIIQMFMNSDMFKQWHWFSYHFGQYTCGFEHPFAKSIIEALLNIEKNSEGYAPSLVKRIASISGREKFKPHYSQLLQVCSEIYVLNQVVNYFDDCPDVEIELEPTCGNSNKNPEFVIRLPKYSIGVEVKQPDLFDHMIARAQNPIQLPVRSKIPLGKKENVTLPRDNPIKDFLKSADSKFKNFKEDPNFYSILFIVWDDYIYEPISALLGEPSGLFLEGSFANDKDENRLSFPNVDAVIIDRQLRQFINASRDEALLHGKKHAMEYGNQDQYPFKVIIPCPDSKEALKIPQEVLNCFQVYNQSPMLGAEYIPQELVMMF